jgi:hypothetical protein
MIGNREVGTDIGQSIVSIECQCALPDSVGTHTLTCIPGQRTGEGSLKASEPEVIL